MDAAALGHRAAVPFCYPVGPDSLRLILKAAAGDLKQAVCWAGDRYGPPPADQPYPLVRVAEDGTHEYWAAEAAAPHRRLRYSFALMDRRGRIGWLSEEGLQPERPAAGFFQYAYIAEGDRFAQPPWVSGAVVYQIFPDRFCNGDPSNDPPGTVRWGALPRGAREHAGGDLAGIRQKLGYLQDLGVSVLYLTPVFASPTNHKYQTSDYYRVDPAFGTEEELKRLVAAGRRRGIRFILDGVFNHCGKEWFAFADVLRRGRRSPYADWFYIRSFPVRPSRWNYETFAMDRNMPKLRTAHPAVAAYLLDVAAHWVRKVGIDGWRLDVANEVDHAFWRAFRSRVKGLKPDAWLVGEIWHDAADWLQGDQFDSVTHYPWREAVLGYLGGALDAGAFDRRLARLRYLYPEEAARGLLIVLGTHDTPRVRTVLGSTARAALAAVLLLTAPGVPCLYYGDEIGMEGGPDPDCRRTYPWERPAEQDADLLSLYRRLCAVRRRLPWLNGIGWETCLADRRTGAYAFRRDERLLGGGDSLWVAINRSEQARTLRVPLGRPVAQLHDLLEGEMRRASKVRVSGGIAHVTLPAMGAALLYPDLLQIDR